jgi:23S rRNA G2445 N2-methylase RlmL
MNKTVSHRKLFAAGIIAAAVTTAAYAADEQTMTQPAVTSRTIAVEHIRIASSRPFAEVRQRLESAVPQLDPSIFETLARGDQARAQAYHDNGPKLSIFLSRDHGARLEIAGAKKNAVQYEIGNPLTATKMTRYQLPAALYAPLRVVLFEDEQGHGIFEYDKPSSLFGQFGDERVTDVGRYLDATLEATLRHAAE